MFSVPNRYKQCTNYILSTRSISFSTSSATHLSGMLHREDNNNNTYFKPDKSNNGKNNQEGMCFNQPQSTQIGTKRHLETEIDFSQNDPDTFGNLQCTKETPLEAIEGDEGDREEEMYLENVPTGSRLSNKQYAAMIKDFISNKKVFQSKDCHLIANILKICSVILILFYVSAGRCY